MIRCFTTETFSRGGSIQGIFRSHPELQKAKLFEPSYWFTDTVRILRLSERSNLQAEQDARRRPSVPMQTFRTSACRDGDRSATDDLLRCMRAMHHWPAKATTDSILYPRLCSALRIRYRQRQRHRVDRVRQTYRLSVRNTIIPPSLQADRLQSLLRHLVTASTGTGCRSTDHGGGGLNLDSRGGLDGAKRKAATLATAGLPCCRASISNCSFSAETAIPYTVHGQIGAKDSSSGCKTPVSFGTGTVPYSTVRTRGQSLGQYIIR